MSSEPNRRIIETAHLKKTYRVGATETVAVADISVSIQAGEFVAIMGKSGSGKSTLMHILGFLDRPTAGRYIFDEQDITHLAEDELAFIRNDKVGFVFQAFHLLPRQTVLENVMLPLVYSRTPVREHVARAQHAVDQVGMSHRLHYFPPQLSGGEKQRVAIARALVNHPDIILADEPTGNLDTHTGEVVMHTIANLNQQGHTIILVTHETTTASFANRIIELQDGAVVSDRANPQRHEHYQK